MSQLQVSGEAKIRDIQGPVIANSGVITALDGAASQYVRGDGTLADFPTSTGGGSSVSYYLNSSVSQGTIGGVAYRELSKEPIIGAGTDITISANGYVASYITDANDPDVLSVPGGNFNCEFYFSVNNNTGNPTTYAELYKYDGTTFTLLGSSVAVPESLNQGTTIAPYYFAIPVATAALALTDRLAIRIYVSVDGRVVTLHTENSHLCQVVTTFSKGMVSLNNLTDQSQFITTGTSGTNFAIVSSGDTHTFNLPVASATNTGKLSNTDWSTFNNKVPYTGATGNVDLGLFGLTSNAVKAIGDNSTYGGVISIKQNNVIGGLIGTGYTELFGKTNRLGISFGAGSIAYLSNSVLTAERTYTLPDLSGTLALLEGTQTFSGSKTFSANPSINAGGQSSLSILSSTGNSALILGYVNNILKGTIDISATEFKLISAIDNILKFQSSNNFRASLIFSNSADYSYIFPSSSGTIALTSDLSAYVTLATTQTISGLKTFDAAISANYGIALLNGAIPPLTSIYYAALSGNSTGLSITYRTGGGTNYTNNLNFPANNNSYLFPSASGTLALTSDLSAYLPLTGGTLTGGLSGTTATFSGLGTFYQLTMTGATAGRIFYAQTGGVVSQSGNLNWNETNGMLGVGTPNPSAVITAFSNNAATQFKAAGTAPAFTFSESLTTSTYACVFGLATSANHFITGTAAGDMAIANQSATAGAIVFGTGTAEKMRMSSSGNFGIGTSSPSYTLDITGGGRYLKNNEALRLQSVDSNGNYISFLFGTSAFAYIGSNYHLATGSPSANDLGIRGENNLIFLTGGPTERMRITSSGNVGIGTSSPANILTVQANDTFNQDSSGQIVIRGASNTAKRLGIGFDTTNNYGYLQAIEAGVATRPLVLQPFGGDVCIGTTSSSGAGLTIVDGKYIWSLGTYNNTTAQAANMWIGSSGIFGRSTSSIKYKTDVVDYNKGLEIINKLRPVYYKGINDGDTIFAGLIAEEVHDLGLIEFVQYAEDGSPDALAYQNMVALLIKGIQEQQAQIEELKALINK